MSTELRRLRHPGPALKPRAEIVAGTGRVATAILPAGASLHDALVRELGAQGIASAALSFGELVLDPLVYYLPALVEGPYPRFWYSEGQKPDGGGRLDMAQASFGRRDGEPFIHCHAVWLEQDGQWHGGHVVPTESVLARPAEVRIATLPGAAILSEHDPETDYPLFHPVPVEAKAPGAGGVRMAYVRVKPNEDIVRAAEEACRQLGYEAATLRGLGSLIGARFADGTVLDDMGSEVLVTRGRVAPGPDGSPRAELDICFAGFSGLASRGRLLRGENPVCITFEMLIEEGWEG